MGEGPVRAARALIAAAVIFGGCGDEPAPPPPSGSGAPALAAPSSRRPTRRAYLGRTTSRCELYSEDGDEKTEPIETPCPQILEIGERIRMAGKTCFLENKAQAEREKPVVCPFPLIEHDQKARERARR